MFIKSIKFPEWHPFYNNWKLIEFGDEQKDLIDFYLKTTEKEWEKDINFANNIQINCILGDNGVGKSRFLKFLYPNDRNDSEDKIEIKFWGEKKYKWAKVIFDDFHNISSNNWYSIHSPLFEKYQKSRNFESIYLQIQWFIEKKSTIKSIFRDFLNLEENFKSNLSLKPNYEWYNDFWGSHIEFIETSTKEWLDDFINSRLYQDREGEWDKKDLLSIFQFLYNKSNNKFKKVFLNLNKLIKQEVAFEYWLLLSDLFISLLNEFRNWIDFVTNTPEKNFIKLKNYKEFKEILEYLFYFLQENRWKIEKIKEKIHWEWSMDYFIGIEDILTYYDNSIFSIKYLLQIFNELEKEETEIDNLANAKKLSDEYFWLSLHELFRHLSGYEKTYVGANDYFIVELAMKFSTWGKSKKNEEKIARTFQWIFYYIFRNPIQEKLRYNLDDYKINFDGTYNLSNKEHIILSFPLFKQHFEFIDKNWIKSIEQLSWWEKAMLLRFSGIYISILESLKTTGNFIILIDEPDLHLHLDWQRQYIQRLIDIFSSSSKDITFHFIIATHSPFIVSDLPGENIIRMRKDNNGVVTFQNYWEWEKDKKNSFWANYIDIIQEWFFDNRLLMWSFAEEVITNLAITEKIKLSKELLGDSYRSNESYKRIENYMLEWIERIKQAKNQIWDTFLKNYLLYFKTDENNTNS